ncbi:MAG TPA: hypothetical protein PLG90_01645 [Ignavibacteria bacterium]|nr:hypothetical protein [Ignavibacteria bacterium]
MKKTEKVLYITGVIIVVVSLFGGSLFKGIFVNMSEYILQKAGLRYEYITFYDGKIDDVFFQIKQTQLQIEKIKNFFSRDSIDESKFTREESKILENSIYRPIVEFISILLRFVFLVLSIIMILTGVIIGTINKNKSLKQRLEILEQKVSMIA